MRRCPQCANRLLDRGWQCTNCGFAPRVVDAIPLLAPAIAEWTGEDARYQYDELHDAESRHFWFVSRARLVAWAIHRYFPQAATLFDVGCGTGGLEVALSRLRPALKVVGGEAQIAGLRFARRRLPAMELIQCDIRSLPFEDEFDVTGAFDVLEHLDDDEAVLREMHKATRPGGGIIITVPQHQWLWTEVDDFSRHRRRYSRTALAGRIEAAGFRLLRVTSFMSLTLPAMMLSRLGARTQRSFDPTRELRIDPIANRILSAICAIERVLVQAKVPLPVGGSLLAVAVRP